MEEILNKLLESELLSEETKVEIKEQMSSFVSNLREEVTLEVRAELAEQWTKERDSLVQSVDQKVTEMVSEEMTDLKEDISRFRDLEVEYADKLVAEKHRLAEKLAEEIDFVVEKLDSFLEYRLSEEMTEFKEDLDTVKQNDFGRKIFESFMAEFNKSFVDEDSVQRKLSVVEEELAEAKKQVFEMEQVAKRVERAKKLEEVLSPLSGMKREQMEIILSNVGTDKLQEAYNRFIGKILKETTEEKTEKEVITESVKTEEKTTLVTGDKVDVEVLSEEVKATKSDEELQKTLRLAGVR